jgi:hypothetical protein
MRIRIEAIRPRKSPVINTAAFIREMSKAVDKSADDMLADFRKTTRTWKTDVKFYARPKGGRLGRRDLVITVYTNSQIYQYVEAGTKPHTIRPKKAKALKFLSNYRAKTRPGFIGSGSGGASGDDVFAQEVHHPGAKARNFAAIIAKRHAPRFKKNVDAAMARAARARR